MSLERVIKSGYDSFLWSMKGTIMVAVMRRAKAKQTEVVTRSVMLPKEIDDKLLAIAQRDERPLSWVIAKAVKELIERDGKKTKS